MLVMSLPWIALVGPELEENLSLRYLASALAHAGWRSEIVPFNRPRDLPTVVRTIAEAEQPPLFVGISMAFQWRAVEMLSAAVGLREAGYRGHITAGGHFATFAAEDLLGDFGELDSICRHESEETVVELASALANGDPLTAIAGIVTRDAAGDVVVGSMRHPPDLASLIHPDRRGPPKQCFGHALAPLVSSRGCYADCSFCCIASWHEQTLPGKRYRVRPPEDVADEMVALKRDRGIEIFIFHDDNFFVPSKKKNLERFHALADALEEREIGQFGIVVKARPNDADLEVFGVMRNRLNALRSYVGIETDADQGLVTLQRRLASRQNHAAIEVLRELDMFGCFNMLIFDPDTTLESLETNFDFMAAASDFPFNFCRTELYAGTPLLRRMQMEGRTTGDWLHHDYRLRTPDVQRVFEMANAAFTPRNFGPGAVHNNMGGWRLELETCRLFHADVFRPGWLTRMKALHRRVGLDTVANLRAIMAHVRSKSPAGDAAFVTEIGPGLRELEREVTRDWGVLKAEMIAACASTQHDPKTIGQDATPLQRAVPVDETAAEVLHYV
jgi:radical SAM superfamily enzyme YgiQ (UPF0313 family)